MKTTTVLASISATVLLFTGCNTVAPNARVDRTSLTQKMNFAQVKKAYIASVYSKDEFLKNVYFAWLKDNLERVNPFLNLKKWRNDVEIKHQKDLKYVEKVEKNYLAKKCGARDYLLPLFSIRYKTHWAKLEDVRYKIVKNLIKLKCGGKYTVPLVLHPDPKNDEAWYCKREIRPEVWASWKNKSGM